MKHTLHIIFFLIISVYPSFGQTFNWNNKLDSTRHIANVNLGWDYAAIVELNYSYKFPCKRPLLLQTGVSIPFGKHEMDDFKSHLGVSGLLFNKSSFKSVLSLNGIHKRYQTTLVKINNFGLELKTINGIYKPKWFVALELGLDIALSTHFKHSDTYKRIIYAEVVDGWYKPLSAGIMNLGFQTGYSFKKSDLVFRIGYYKSITSSVNVLIPYYMTLGYNLRIN